MNDKTLLTDYFKAVDRQFASLRSGDDATIQTKLCDYIIEMRFLQKEYAECVKKYLFTPVLDKFVKPDAVLSYWTDDIKTYSPAGTEGITAVWKSTDKNGELLINPVMGMFGIDYERERYYQCREPFDDTDYIIHGHSMAPLLSRWAIRNDLLFLHSACIGVDGKGVMLSARGGGGKSTLAVSCMGNGFDFVSDDYIVVNQKGPLVAKPVYSVIGINQDVAAVLKPQLPILRTEPKRGDKLYLKAPDDLIKDSLPVNAIISPNVCDAEKPEIVRTDPGPVLVRVIETSAKNMQSFRDSNVYRTIAQRLMGVPVYEFRLTRDLFKNRDYLRDFIIKEL